MCAYDAAAALPKVLKWLKKDPQQQQEGQGHDDDLLWKLASQRDKENGSTPLHLAASWGGLPSTNYWILGTHPYFWGRSRKPAKLLLDANESMAYQPDKRGLYPIHAAAAAGCVRVVKALLEDKQKRFTECAILRDAKGRTFLHVAVDKGWHRVVRYVCVQSHRNKNPAAGLLCSILNAQDSNGDTPLHRAVHAGNWKIFNRLVQNRQDSRLRIRQYLLRVGAPYGETRADRSDPKPKHILFNQDEEKMSKKLTAAAQVLCIFSVLITTVTFASAFTLPGGYRSAGDAAAAGGVAGTPVLAGRRSYAFDGFVLSDTLAFMCSLYATSVLLYVGMACGTLTSRFSIINLAYTLMWHAGRSLVAAFGLGLYIVLLPVDRTIAITVAVLMVIISIGFLKSSEGINSMVMIGRLPIPASWDVALGWVIYVLDHFWSYMIIFGLPAIRKWARLH